mmetsp:Transcript_90777/g.293051  ORF Transcript_90777/g.293051 Transcript_90777/m.293051 type:complete len:433 (+) Transcript_90777:2541-3839(+)
MRRTSSAASPTSRASCPGPAAPRTKACRFCRSICMPWRPSPRVCRSSFPSSMISASWTWRATPRCARSSPLCPGAPVLALPRARRQAKASTCSLWSSATLPLASPSSTAASRPRSSSRSRRCGSSRSERTSRCESSRPPSTPSCTISAHGRERTWWTTTGPSHRAPPGSSEKLTSARPWLAWRRLLRPRLRGGVSSLRSCTRDWPRRSLRCRGRSSSGSTSPPRACCTRCVARPCSPPALLPAAAPRGLPSTTGCPSRSYRSTRTGCSRPRPRVWRPTECSRPSATSARASSASSAPSGADQQSTRGRRDYGKWTISQALCSRSARSARRRQRRPARSSPGSPRSPARGCPSSGPRPLSPRRPPLLLGRPPRRHLRRAAPPPAASWVGSSACCQPPRPLLKCAAGSQMDSSGSAAPFCHVFESAGRSLDRCV